jgi:hypothetical protein
MTRNALLLLTLCLASPALAQPVGGGIAPAIDPSVTPASPALILFSLQDRPVNHPLATVTEQMRLQIDLLRRLLQKNDGSQSDLFRRVHDSIFSVARGVLNHELREKSPELARALLGYVSEDTARLLKDRHSNYREAGGPLGPRPIMYDTARAVVQLLPADDRAGRVAALRGIVGATPYEGGLGCKDREFMTNLLLVDVLVDLYPQLPVTHRHEWNGYYVDRVEGDLGDAIQGLARGLTLGGRKKNIARVHAAIDALEASNP